MASGYINLPVTGGGGGSGITQLSGEVTAGPGTGNQVATVSNAAVIGKVLTGYASTTGTVTASDTILSAIGKLNGNTAAISAGAVTSLTGEVSGTGPGATATTISNAAVIAKILTGYTSGAGTVAATDSILQAIQKLNGNTTALSGTTTSGLALKVDKAGDTMTGNLTFNGPTAPIAIGPRWTTAGSLRIAMTTVNGESGSNNGSDFRINRYDDSGNLLGPGMQMARASGNITFPNNMIVGNSLSVVGPTYNTDDVTIEQAANTQKGYNFTVGTVQRWKTQIAGLESTGNAGSDLQFVRYDDSGNSLGNALAITRSNALATFGGAVTTNGNLTVTGGAAVSGTTTVQDDVMLNQTANAQKGYTWTVGGLNRWKAFLVTAETGSNAGSDLRIMAYNDAGTALTSAMTITRSNSAVTIATLTVAGALTVNGPLNTTNTQVNVLAGAFRFSTRTVTASTTLDTANRDNIIFFNHTASATLTLTAIATAGVARRITIKDITGQANNFPITITPNGAELIDGKSSFIITQPYGSVDLINNGTNWFVL